MDDKPAIKEFLQAGYPALFMPTVEPDVAEARVRGGLLELGLGSVDFGIWKITNGFRVGSADGTIKPKQKAEDLFDTLAMVETAEGPLIAVLHNIRTFVQNPQIIQALVDAIFAVRLKGSHLILVGPMIDLPPELKTLITWVDCPLPTRDRIKSAYGEIVEAYRSEIEDFPRDKGKVDSILLDAATAAIGLDMMGAENAIALSLAMTGQINSRIIQAQKEQEVRKSDVLEFVQTDEVLENIGGWKQFKYWLSRRRKAFTDEARTYGLPYPKGMLIVGCPGTGKSLAAKAVAGYLRLPLLRLDMGKVFRSLVGESEAAIRLALQVVEAVSPVVLWMDEIDKGLAGMRGSGELDSGVTARVISTILTWRQETTYPVVLVGTANDVAAIPSMVYRKGRLDEIWATDLPTVSEREEIFAIHLRRRNRDPKRFNVALLAVKSVNMVGAEIEGAIEDAMFAAFDRGIEVATVHIIGAISEMVPQAVRDVEEIKAIREWVEQRARAVSEAKEGDKPKSSKNKVRKLRTKRAKKED